MVLPPWCQFPFKVEVELAPRTDTAKFSSSATGEGRLTLVGREDAGYMMNGITYTQVAIGYSHMLMLQSSCANVSCDNTTMKYEIEHVQLGDATI